jgi:hypothetical protein
MVVKAQPTDTIGARGVGKPVEETTATTVRNPRPNRGLRVHAGQQLKFSLAALQRNLR